MGVNIAALLERAPGRGAGLPPTTTSRRATPASGSGSRWASSRSSRRDKLTFVVDEPIASFGLWVEQLIAESTGKEGKGILPVADEPRRRAGRLRRRPRVRVPARQAATGEHDSQLGELARAGHPVFTLDADGPLDLGRIFFFAEFATAVAGWVLGHQPVRPAERAGGEGQHGQGARAVRRGGRAARGRGGHRRGAARAARRTPSRRNYIAIMGYVEPSDAFDAAVAELRVGDPRRDSLHDDVRLRAALPPLDRPVPQGRPADRPLPPDRARRRPTTSRCRRRATRSATLKNAQATGDLQTLRAHGLLAERVRLEGDPVQGVRDLTERIKGLID